MRDSTSVHKDIFGTEMEQNVIQTDGKEEAGGSRLRGGILQYTYDIYIKTGADSLPCLSSFFFSKKVHSGE